MSTTFDTYFDGLKHSAVVAPAVELSTGQDIPEIEWNGIVRSLNGNFMHSMAWSQYHGRPVGKPFYLVMRQFGEVAAAGWYVLSTRTLGSIPLTRHLHMETFPCYDRDRIPADTVLRSVYALAKQEGCASISFGNSSREFPVNASQARIQEKISFYLDLQKSEQELIDNLQPKHHRKIRKAAESGIEVRTFSDDKAFAIADAVDGLFEYTLYKHVALGKDRRKGQVRSMRDIVQELVVTGNAILFVAFSDNAPVSCYVVSLFNKEAYNLFGASNAKGYALNASFLLIWRIARYFKEHGYRILHLGEVLADAENESDINHGLFRHKAGFGAATNSLWSGTIVLRPLTYSVMLGMGKCRSAALISGRILASWFADCIVPFHEL